MWRRRQGDPGKEDDKYGQSVLGIKLIFAFLSINYHDGCLSYDTGLSGASRESSSI